MGADSRAATRAVFAFICVALAWELSLTLVLFSCEKNEHIDCSLIILFMTLIYKINKYCQILVISGKWLHFSSTCELLFFLFLKMFLVLFYSNTCVFFHYVIVMR